MLRHITQLSGCAWNLSSYPSYVRMSSTFFKIVEHKAPTQHIREYPRATLHKQEDVLHLAVKQYIPLDNPSPKPGDITIIGAHACGFPKELYEPLWDDLLVRLRKRKIGLRSIWIADLAQQGQSGILNEELLGNDPSWNDHARDLLHLINMNRDQMPRPIVGIGHSMGGNQLVNVAYMHPRLFTTLILLDPVIHPSSSTPPDKGPNPALLSTWRRDVWPSREEVAQSYKKSKFYQQWDPRVLDRWIKYGLRDLPTPTHPENAQVGGKTRVTLSTPKHQEVFTFLRPNYDNYGPDVPPNRSTHADLNPSLGTIYPFYRPEPPQTYYRLPELRPSVMYVFGGQSDMVSPEAIREKMVRTGTGLGGSGGEKDGRVKSVTFDDIGHLIAMEAVDRTADVASEWLDSEMQRWTKGEEEFRKSWDAKSRKEKTMIDAKWYEMMGPIPGKKGRETKL